MPITLQMVTPQEREGTQARTHGTAHRTHKSARRIVSRLMIMCLIIRIQTGSQRLHIQIPPKDKRIPEMNSLQSSIMVWAAMSAAGENLMERDINARCVLTTICVIHATMPLQYHSNTLMSTKWSISRNRFGMKLPELSL